MTILLPHLVDAIGDSIFRASPVMRAWMEQATERVNINDAALRGFVFVSDISDLPEAVSGVITLTDNYTYFFTTTVDLSGARIVGGQNSVILGASSENCRIKSTGLGSGTALISSEWSMPIRHITFEAATIFDLDANGNAGQALDWHGVNLVGSSDIGTIANYNNFIASSMAFLGVSGLVFDGSFGTIAFSDTLFSGADPGTIITIPATATISRRFRVVYSSFVVTGSGVGINFSLSATAPNEGYILDTVNFSGGGTYTQGASYEDGVSWWRECRGVKNSAVLAGYYMNGNGTATTIAAQSTPVKVAGTTTATAITQRFTVSTSNRATCDSPIERDYKITAIFTASGGNNHELGFYIAKDGVVINESETYITANAAGRLENGAVQVTTTLVEDEYIELWVEDTNVAFANVTVEDLNLIIEPIN